MEAASVLTTVATKATINAQAYGKMGLQILIQLLKQFPNREFVHDLVANMVSNVSANRPSSSLRSPELTVSQRATVPRSWLREVTRCS